MAPDADRYWWRYDHSQCRDTRSGRVWTLRKYRGRYLFYSDDNESTGPYTRRTTAVRGLLRYIKLMDERETEHAEANRR